MKSKMGLLSVIIVGVIAILTLKVCTAEEVFTIIIEQNQFQPEVLKVPAHQKIKLIIENHDASAEEFESYDLHREKVVAGKSKITIFIGPLKPGVYKYFGEFHPKTAQGKIVAE